jgi:hypothetical protein
MALTAGKIWKSFGYKWHECNELISQIRNYYLKNPPFNLPYLPEQDTPLKWWSTCFSEKQHLQELAIRLFSITPNTASCERIWSTVGWFYGKRRTRLSIQTIESLSKIHRYYITNIKKELSYSSLSISDDEVIQMVQESLTESYEEPVENDDDELIIACLNSPEISNNNRNEVILKTSKLYNLSIITLEDKNNDSISISEILSDDDELASEFNIEDLVSYQFD